MRLVRWGEGLSYFLGGRILADFLDVVKKEKSQTYIGNLVKKTFPKHTLEIQQTTNRFLNSTNTLTVQETDFLDVVF